MAPRFRSPFPGACDLLRMFSTGGLECRASFEARTAVEQFAKIGIEPRQQRAGEQLVTGPVRADADGSFGIGQVAAQQRHGVSAKVIGQANLRQCDRGALDGGVHRRKQRRRAARLDNAQRLTAYLAPRKRDLLGMLIAVPAAASMIAAPMIYGAMGGSVDSLDATGLFVVSYWFLFKSLILCGIGSTIGSFLAKRRLNRTTWKDSIS